jgi:hypothetical protein
MSDTPETDRLAEEFKSNTLPDDVKLDILFSYTRKLERECIRLEQVEADNTRILNEWYKDCELLHAQLADLHHGHIVELEQDLIKAAKVLKHIEEQSRQNVTVVVGAPLREAVCSCLDSICEKVDLSKILP